MAYDRRSFAGAATATTISSGIDSSTLSISIADATGWPSGSGGDFFAVIDRGTATEEKVRVASRSTLSLTVATGGRGVDGTAAVAHSASAAIEVCVTATDLDEANAHIADTNLDHHTQYLNETRHDDAARHTFGAALGTPGTPESVGTTAAVGTGAAPAREDHVHDLGAGAIDAANLFTSGVIEALMFQPGDLKVSARSSTPTGWLLCDGSAVSRATYSDLFSAIGTAYGTGDGSTTFNVPDYRGRTILGAGTGSSLTARALGDTGGAETHTLTTDEIPSHNHGGTTGSNGAHTHSGTTGSGGSHDHDPGGASSTGFIVASAPGGTATGGAGSGWAQTSSTASAGSHTHSFTTGSSGSHTHSVSSQGGGSAHNNMQPFGVANVFIKT